MPYTLEGVIKRFIGQSSDAKPADGVPAGSSFLENDTGKIYRYDGASWKHVEAEDDSVAILQMILMELGRLRQLVELTVNST